MNKEAMHTFDQICPKNNHTKNNKGKEETLNINLKTITTNNDRWDVPASTFYHFFGGGFKIQDSRFSGAFLESRGLDSRFKIQDSKRTS